MREYDIITEPLTFIHIKHLAIHRQVGEHGRARLEGHIADEDEQSFLEQLCKDVWEKIEIVGREGDRKTIFHGIVTGFSISGGKDQKQMMLEVTTGTCLMDRRPHYRTFQNPDMTYVELFRQITGNYQDSGLICNRPLTEAIGGLILQYEETDWEFLRRMASRFHSFLTPAFDMPGSRYFYDLQKGDSYELPAQTPCTVHKKITEFAEKRSRGLGGMREGDCLEYEVESREDYRIGDTLIIRGQPYRIWRIESCYDRGELLHQCWLKVREGMDVTETFCEQAAGCSFPARILQVEEDRVQVEALEDENSGQEIRQWYPYATVYSSPDGTGWYCMPEIGDMVRLHIPAHHEEQAYVASAVHLERAGAERSNPDIKRIMNKHRKEIRFTPDSIVLTNNRGTRIALTDQNGIEIVSEHAIALRAREDLTLSSETGSLTAAGTESVNLRQKNTGIDIGKGISFTGGEMRVQ